MIRPYTDTDFTTLAGWVLDADALFRFSGPDWHFPFTHAQILAYRAAHASGLRQFYVGYDEQGRPYAFGEIIDGDANSPRLARIIVDPAQRGCGRGEQFVRELVHECGQRLQPPHVYLFVLDKNTAAIRCYEKIGFRFDGEEKNLIHAGREQKMRRMCFKYRPVDF